MMVWKKLLSGERRSGQVGSRTALRSPFERDYHRIIGSAAFRRLQDKTQVFPLDKSDFIRTRLTHSLEVSSNGRSIGESVGEALLESGIDPTFTSDMKADMCQILQCAGLIHDIGNPPFGHFGEETIRDWFVKNLPGLTFEGRAVTELLSDWEKADLLHFEGNAQGLRLVAGLHFPDNGFGMDLTYGLLAAMIKYPTSSLKADPAAADAKDRKMGYFKAERTVFEDIERKTGTEGKRSPLALMLEAADDIAYATADIEDAFKKGYLDMETLTGELKSRGVSGDVPEMIKAACENGVTEGVHDAQEYAVMSSIPEIQDLLVKAAADSFLTHYGEIMEGSYPYDLFAGTKAESLIRALKTIAYDRAFTTADIFRTEIAANTILTYLLDHLVPAALAYDTGHYPGLMEEKFLSLISDNHKMFYRRFAEGKTEGEKVYLRLLLAADSISGMTDSHARDLYRELTGQLSQ